MICYSMSAYYSLVFCIVLVVARAQGFVVVVTQTAWDI